MVILLQGSEPWGRGKVSMNSGHRRQEPIKQSLINSYKAHGGVRSNPGTGRYMIDSVLY